MVANVAVSAVLPVRNGERFLSQAIESVLTQDHGPIDLIVIDGDSTDRSPDIARSYQDVRYIEQRRTDEERSGWRGLAAAWDLGVELARGDLVGFLGADDIWRPEKISKQVALLSRSPGMMAAIGGVRLFVEDGYTLPRGFNPIFLDRNVPGWMPETLLARKEAFDVVGSFSGRLATAQEVDWFFRAKDLGLSMGMVPETVVDKRLHNANLSAEAEASIEALCQVVADSLRRRRAGSAR